MDEKKVLRAVVKKEWRTFSEIARVIGGPFRLTHPENEGMKKTLRRLVAKGRVECRHRARPGVRGCGPDEFRKV